MQIIWPSWRTSWWTTPLKSKTVRIIVIFDQTSRICLVSIHELHVHVSLVLLLLRSPRYLMTSFRNISAVSTPLFFFQKLPNHLLVRYYRCSLMWWDVQCRRHLQPLYGVLKNTCTTHNHFRLKATIAIVPRIKFIPRNVNNHEKEIYLFKSKCTKLS